MKSNPENWAHLAISGLLDEFVPRSETCKFRFKAAEMDFFSSETPQAEQALTCTKARIWYHCTQGTYNKIAIHIYE